MLELIWKIPKLLDRLSVRQRKLWLLEVINSQAFSNIWSLGNKQQHNIRLYRYMFHES